jgi:hypothetical protein
VRALSLGFVTDTGARLRQDSCEQIAGANEIAMPSMLPIRRLLAWSVAILAFWPLVSAMTWVLPSEDGERQLLALALLAAAAAVRVCLYENRCSRFCWPVLLSPSCC